MCRNVERVNRKEKEGMYLKEALEEAYAYLGVFQGEIR